MFKTLSFYVVTKRLQKISLVFYHYFNNLKLKTQQKISVTSVNCLNNVQDSLHVLLLQQFDLYPEMLLFQVFEIQNLE